jgi:hypothetical protein
MGGGEMSQPISDGGSAFPKSVVFDQVFVEGNGMTLRDYFAGQAMAAIITSVYCTPETIYTEVSSRAYAQADAMLKAREAK